jgi:integration host factor subunit beta
MALSDTITRSQLIEKLAERYSYLLSVQDVDKLVKSLIEQMSQTLAQGDRVEIRGFGSFNLHLRRKQLGRNPKSGAPVLLEEKYVPHFKPGKELRERVNAGLELASP